MASIKPLDEAAVVHSFEQLDLNAVQISLISTLQSRSINRLPPNQTLIKLITLRRRRRHRRHVHPLVWSLSSPSSSSRLIQFFARFILRRVFVLLIELDHWKPIESSVPSSVVVVVRKPTISTPSKQAVTWTERRDGVLWFKLALIARARVHQVQQGIKLEGNDTTSAKNVRLHVPSAGCEVGRDVVKSEILKPRKVFKNTKKKELTKFQ